MKRYYIPQIEITHFLTEIVVASSGKPQRAYIAEVNSLEATLTSAEHQKRMESFADVLAFNQ